MSMLLRSMLVLGVTSLLVVGCGEKEEAAPAEATTAPVTAPVAAPAAVEPGGYVPTAEERVPGITIDPATLDAAAAEAAPATTEAAPAAENVAK